MLKSESPRWGFEDVQETPGRVCGPFSRQVKGTLFLAVHLAVLREPSMLHVSTYYLIREYRRVQKYTDVLPKRDTQLSLYRSELI